MIAMILVAVPAVRSGDLHGVNLAVVVLLPLAAYEAVAVLAPSALAAIRVEQALAIGANTDILFPVQQQEEIATGLAAGGARAQFVGLDSPQGHDAFLVDYARFGPVLGGFLAGLE